MDWLLAMACPVAYTTTKKSYSKKAAFISQSKATPDPRKKKKNKKQKSNKEQAFKTYSDYVSNLLDSTANPDLPTLGKRFWSFIKSMKQDNVGISPLKKNGIGEDVHDG